MHALLLLLGVLLVAGAVLLSVRAAPDRGRVSASWSAPPRWPWYIQTDVVPDDFTTMTPYVATLLVLALASQRLRMPAADGLPYRRGQGG